MSLKKFLHRLWTGIKGIFDKIEDDLKRLVPVAIKVVEAIKTFDESIVSDVLTTLIPGEVDDKIMQKLREFLPKILLELNMVDSIIGITDPNEQLKAILARIKLSPKNSQDVFYHGIASLILSELSDGKFSWSDAVAVAEYYYKYEFQPGPAEHDPNTTES